MPFYEYECTSCKFYTEVLQKITDRPLRKCPACGRNTLKKLVSAPVFRLKGGGWYETDFKSDKETRRNLAQAEKSEPAPESSGSGDSKPEAAKPAASDSKAASAPAPTPAKPSEHPRPARARARTSAPVRTAKAKGVGSSAARARPARKSTVRKAR